MMDFLKTLGHRKAEREQKNASAWAELVKSLDSAKTPGDADRVLAELERHGKTLEELEAASDLLAKRRMWAKQVADAQDAESKYQKLITKISAENDAFEKLFEEHEARLQTLVNQRNQAASVISLGADARRRLLDTAAPQSAVEEVALQIADTQAELDQLRERIRQRETWITKVKAMGESASTADTERFAEKSAELSEMKRQERDFESRLAELAAEHQRAMASMLKPEAI